MCFPCSSAQAGPAGELSRFPAQHYGTSIIYLATKNNASIIARTKSFYGYAMIIRLWMTKLFLESTDHPLVARDSTHIKDMNQPTLGKWLEALHEA